MDIPQIYRIELGLTGPISRMDDGRDYDYAFTKHTSLGFEVMDESPYWGYEFIITLRVHGPEFNRV